MIRKLLSDYNIPFVADGEHQHNTAGWVNVHCPFCSGSPNFHLGIDEERLACHCWRCGGHNIIKTLSALLHLSETSVHALLRQYGLQSSVKITTRRTSAHVQTKAFRFPRPYTSLTTKGMRYLENRGFDAEKIARKWRLKETGPVSYLDKVSYANRIIIPIFWDRKVVSFQARDLTGLHPAKYMACPKSRERIHHKNIVYTSPKHKETMIVVEGPADVWRLGSVAAATMGIKFTMSQVMTIASLADRIIILYDAERQAQTQARALATKLKALGKSVGIETLQKGDPADLTDSDAKHLVKQILRRRY